MSDQLLARYRRLIRNPNGLLLIAGPTLSGKTNTLYATISTLRERDVKRRLTRQSRFADRAREGDST